MKSINRKHDGIDSENENKGPDIDESGDLEEDGPRLASMLVQTFTSLNIERWKRLK